MSESKHSPLPWRAHDEGRHKWYIEHSGDYIADCLSESDAKLIAVAVNSHAELLSSLNELREAANESFMALSAAMTAMRLEPGAMKHFVRITQNGIVDGVLDRLADVIEKTDAAIRKASGGAK